MAVNLDGEQQAVVEPSGYLDTPTTQAFEQQILELLDGGARFFAIGFGRVTLMTSAGIRVLVELTRRLEPHQGALVLYGLNDRITAVLRVTGLIERFRIVASREDAVSALAERRASPAANRRRSSLTRLVGQVLGSSTDDPTAAPLAAGTSGSARSSLAEELARLLERPGSHPG